MVKLAVSLGAGSVKFNPVTPTGRGKIMEKQGETLDYEETIRLVRFVRGELQSRYPVRLHISISPALSTIREILRGESVGGECRVLNILGILGNGEMALCGIGRNMPELCFGRLGKANLRDVWISHPTLVGLRHDLTGDYPGVCGDCIHAKRCLTQCVAMNYSRMGTLLNPDFLCAEAERRGIFPATRKRSHRDIPDGYGR
jgi:radical SAM protein with 4Fe4S-binding SPASM domain